MAFSDRVSLIITTHNWHEALRTMLRSVLVQSRLPDEMIVADDGSSPETFKAVEEILRPSNLRWRHVWHDDKGVRQSRIKNLAVRYSSGSYFIWVDHDTVLHRDFIADHVAMAEGGTFLQGKRVLLSEAHTRKLLGKGSYKQPHFWNRSLGNRKNTLRIPAIGRLLARPKGFETSIRGCNLSMFKEDFLEVDGFDETFDGSWGREDSDLCYRLFHAGLKVKTLWFMAIQYHLRHKVVSNWDRERLDQELLRNLGEKRVKALKGFSQLGKEGILVASSDDS